MDDVPYGGRRRPGARHRLRQHGRHRAGRVMGCGQYLADRHLASGVVDEDQVGKGAADVHPGAIAVIAMHVGRMAPTRS